MQNETTHYCVGHKKKHPFEDWRWSTKKEGKKTIYYCGKCIDCAGCGEIHDSGIYGGYRSTYDSNGKPIQVCFKHVKPSSPSVQERMRNLSPEEVLSGVQYGFKKDPMFKNESKSDFHAEHNRQKKELGKALDAV